MLSLINSMLQKLGVVLFLLPTLLFSQELRRCGFLEAQDYLFKIDEQAKAKVEIAVNGFEGEAFSQNKSLAQAIYTIPVVFHILHLGGAENINDAQILDALFVLNRDFNKQNPDTVNTVGAFQGIASDCQIEFKLATLDENGNCTTGITRHYDNASNWAISSSYYKYTWNRTKYLNIYVVKSLPPGVAAYTFLPGTTSAVMDAVVILHNYVGSIGTGSPFGSRTLTHEVGHWFNLQHTWGSNNQPGTACGDDGVGDTPLTKGFSFCNLANSAVCTAGVEENVQNYMEYAFCSNMFTLGQRNRMHNALNSANAGRINLWSPGNLQFTGVLNSTVACAPKADFMANRAVACIGDTVNFTDFSYNGSINTWEWSSVSASGSSTLQNGALVFNQTGPAHVKLKITNNNGMDSVIKTLVLILPAANSGTNNLVQSFEVPPFPDNNWLRTEPQYGSAFLTTSLSARSGSNCLWVNNFYDTPNEPVAFYTPAFVFQGFNPAQLSFYYAYAQKSTNSNDRLKIFASTNCGWTWNQLLDMGGASLTTVQSTLNTAFFATAQQFNQGLLDLSDYADEQVYLKFEFSPDNTGPGNNLFIDDIMVTGLTRLQEESEGFRLSLYPNPTQREICIHGVETKTLLRVQLMDLAAHCVFETQALGPQGCMSLPEQLNEGMYFLQLHSVSGTKTFKVIIQK